VRKINEIRNFSQLSLQNLKAIPPYLLRVLFYLQKLYSVGISTYLCKLRLMKMVILLEVSFKVWTSSDNSLSFLFSRLKTQLFS
jgi:hypothetical protein